MERIGSPQRLGVFGGTFDPPHVGHLILAQTALDTLGLTQVLFIPAADPPHKLDRTVTPVQHRVAMVQAAIADNANFVLSRIDIDRPGPHFTVDTLRLLSERYPQADLYFLMGADSLRDLLTWRDPEGIVALAHLTVMGRPDTTFDLTKLTTHIPHLEARTQFVDAPMVGVSATNLRERLRDGHSIRYQVSDPVVQYIENHHLYRD